MAFRQYTKCYDHTPGDTPFNKSAIAGVALLYGVLPGALFGALTGLVLGLLAGGPIGAIVGLFAGITVSVALAPTKVAEEWRYHRLCCLDGDLCAVGTVREQPARGDLGEFDNDQYFDLTLMPHRTGHGTDDPKGPPFGTASDPKKPNGDDYALQSDNYKTGKPGIVFDDEKAALAAHPANDVYTDGFQGQALVRPTIADLPYDTMRSWLHCEVEGDFWQRISELALALGSLIATATLVTVGAGVAGALGGAAAGCAIGGIFGPLGCLIGAIIGAIIGALLAGGAAGLISYLVIKGVLQGIFDESGHGEVEDANVGDASFGPTSAGDRVAVFGTHVYDGFHEGWHEIHPLKAVIKVAAIHGRGGVDETSFYLEWNPNFSGNVPADLPEMPVDIKNLTVADMRAGLNSDKFRKRAAWTRDRWCQLLSEAFSEPVRTTQQRESERWTIHPDVDGCTPRTPPPPIK